MGGYQFATPTCLICIAKIFLVDGLVYKKCIVVDIIVNNNKNFFWGPKLKKCAS